MTKPKLTKSIVDALQPADRDYVTWCGQLPGFGVRTRPTGRKSYIAQYDFNGRTRKVTIGTHGAMTVDQARDEARAVLANAQLGVDKAEAKAKRRAEMTVAELCDEYLAEGCDKKKASTIATDKGRIARHIKPLLGTKKISDVSRGDIERFMRAVAKGKTAKVLTNEKGNRVAVTGGKGTATRTVRLLGGIFSYAVKHGYIATNPRSGVQLYADNKGKRYLSSAEFQRLGDTLREAETIGLPWQFNEGVKEKYRPKKAENQREVISPHAVAAIRLLMLTGCRLSEILKLQWHDVDLNRGVLDLSDSKTGAKEVLLGAAALKVLAEIPRIEGNPYVIAGEVEGKPRSDLKRPWNRITTHAGLPDLRLHDLRHSFASVGVASGMGLPIVGKLLGHASPSTTARYAHIAEDASRRALHTIESTIAAGIGLSVETADVVPIKQVQS
ncbi:MAG: tyrosine-type recombinase/integrase [Novosphingobium sp.]|nr:tyrosine-type recombinase/integrase [Novosphingobium sp.]MCP5401944.1 tyrosine-type recombinase/integrase [Novosphingobium sp.]